jgi:uncharacterized NAD(P)/FAD-binding protein YdhS
MTAIAIVGAGFSGTLLALHLLRRCPQGVTITLIERSIQFGRGAAYATGNPRHLLNVPAGRMSAFHDKPRDFLDWLQRTADPDLAEPVTQDSFVPRRLYGAYIRQLLSREMKNSPLGANLKLVRGDAQRIESADGGLIVQLDRERIVRTDLAVLAVGNFPPEPPPVRDASFYDSDLYRPDPWAADAFSGLDPNGPVLLIGTGLTMVDAVISLLEQGHEGAIYALSRRGLLPHRHAPGAAPTTRCEPFPTSLVELTRFLRSEGARARAEGASWQPVVDELRPFTLDVWAELSAVDRSRFLRHLRPWWEIHRHRMASAVADRLEGALARGQLQVRAGRIQSYRHDGRAVEVTYRKRGTDLVDQVRVARVVNCSGPGSDYGRIQHPLMRSLLEAGLVRPAPQCLGLDVTSSCALKDRRGAISGKLFAVGPVTKGAFWEMTAVPDIRRQCEFLAAHLSTLVKAAPPPHPRR